MEGGGAERVVSLLLNSFAKDFDIHLILVKNAIVFPIPQEINIHILSKAVSSFSLYKIISIPLLAIKLYRFLTKNKIPVCMSFMSRPNFILCLTKIFGSKVETIISERTCPSAYHKSLSKLSAFTSHFLIKKLYPLADKIVVNSKYSKFDLEKNFKINTDKLEVIYNPIELSTIDENLNHRVPNPCFSFIHVGKFRPEKNHLLLIRAFAQLKDLNCRLILVGDGPTMPMVEKEIYDLNIQNKVSLLGFDPNPFKTMINADCLVLCSNFEGFPNVLLEGMACNLPIISTDCHSGPRELLSPETDFRNKNETKVEQAAFGILVPTNSAEYLAEAMRLIYSNKQLRELYREKGNLRAASFSMNTIENQYRKLFA